MILPTGNFQQSIINKYASYIIRLRCWDFVSTGNPFKTPHIPFPATLISDDDITIYRQVIHRLTMYRRTEYTMTLPIEKSPLTEAAYYLLLSLYEPMHGYGIMQNVKIMSSDRVNLGPAPICSGVFIAGTDS